MGDHYPGCQKLFMRGFWPLVSSAEGRKRVGLRSTKLLVTREKKSLVPRVGDHTMTENELYCQSGVAVSEFTREVT